MMTMTIAKNFINNVLLIICFSVVNCRLTLPKVPDVLHPTIPTHARMSNENSQSDLINESELDPEVRPGLFQGDLAMDDDLYKYWRVGIRWDVFPDRKWKQGIIPYVISPLYDGSDYATIYKAIRTINSMTCIRFIPWNGKLKDYLLIWPVKRPAGCWSHVGRNGGVQLLSLQPPDDHSENCLGNEGRAIHELLHAIGIFHEQSRSDRDNYVTIHRDNIIPNYLRNFDKQSLKNTTYSFEYDYASIMHYGEFYFSKSPTKPSITSKTKGIKLGQRRGLTVTDCLKVNDLYGCLDNPAISRKYYNRCKALGI